MLPRVLCSFVGMAPRVLPSCLPQSRSMLLAQQQLYMDPMNTGQTQAVSKSLTGNIRANSKVSLFSQERIGSQINGYFCLRLQYFDIKKAELKTPAYNCLIYRTDSLGYFNFRIFWSESALRNYKIQFCLFVISGGKKEILFSPL